MIFLKTCSECKIKKPLKEYHKNKEGYLGRYSKCKKCKCNYLKDYYNYNKIKYKNKYEIYKIMRQNK